MMAEICLLIITVAIVWLGSKAIECSRPTNLRFLTYERSIGTISSIHAEINAAVLAKRGEVVDMRLYPVSDGGRTHIIVMVIYKV